VACRVLPKQISTVVKNKFYMNNTNNLKLPAAISFDTLPEAVQTILEQVQTLNQKIDNLPAAAQEPDENRFVDLNEIRQIVFPQWKKQTIYNKCSLGELPHSRIGSRLLFNLKECREWRDSQLKKGKIKSAAEIKDDAQAFLEKRGGIV
jgi:predicted DNA-binding transcriptional regulator AlpA